MLKVRLFYLIKGELKVGLFYLIKGVLKYNYFIKIGCFSLLSIDSVKSMIILLKIGVNV